MLMRQVEHEPRLPANHTFLLKRLTAQVSDFLTPKPSCLTSGTERQNYTRLLVLSKLEALKFYRRAMLDAPHNQVDLRLNHRR